MGLVAWLVFGAYVLILGLPLVALYLTKGCPPDA